MLNIEGLKKVQKERLELALRKNTDYSGSVDNVGALGIIGVAVRLFDKASRLCSLVLTNTEQQVKDESIRDTLLDAANYSDYGVMILDGSWSEDTRPEHLPADNVIPVSDPELPAHLRRLWCVKSRHLDGHELFTMSNHYPVDKISKGSDGLRVFWLVDNFDHHLQLPEKDIWKWFEKPREEGI